jgi:tetratricopeptide (TPR) repeat protein
MYFNKCSFSIFIYEIICFWHHLCINFVYIREVKTELFNRKSMIFIKKIAFVVLFLLACTNLHAQKNKAIIDSIETLLKTQTDTNLVKSYSELTWQYRNINRAKAIDYGRKGIALGKKINYPKGLAQVYNDLGIIYYDNEQYDSSIALYNEALKIRQQC